MTLRLDAAARDELLRAIAWYEAQRPALGEELARAVELALLEIERAPERWPRWQLEPRVRRVLLHRFPFAIIYMLGEDGPYVVAIAHARRSARRWLRRLSGASKRPKQ